MQQKNTVKDLMTANPELIAPSATLKEAAQMMEKIGCGVLPVGTNDKLEGIITDRDIVLRAVAKGKDVNSEKVSAHMTAGEPCCCAESDTPEQVGEMMRENRVSRVLVKDQSGKLCGIMTFGRIIRENENLQEIGNVIECAVGEKNAA